ncbi:MAG: hypothetical protein N2321_06670 [Melioribacteraceae bacterium]|nr:hypothetical protein [Melioribacteraceae bacterium]
MKKLSIIFFIAFSILNAQNVCKEFDGNNLSGILYLDAQSVKVATNVEESLIPAKKKTPIIAAGLSFVLPGAGQFYSERYLKSAVFLAIELSSIIVGLHYDKKGDDQTTYFQNFANQHWSVERYAKWTLKNANKINNAVNPNDYKIFENGKINWNELNRLERAIGSYYSHQLPYFGEQQYYELIGKYPQYNVGWDDFGDENTPFEYDPTRKNLTPKFIFYSIERGKANDYYNYAAKAVIVIIVNHFISALDAAWSAHNFNKDLDINLSLEKFNNKFSFNYYPQLNLQYKF